MLLTFLPRRQARQQGPSRAPSPPQRAVRKRPEGTPAPPAPDRARILRALLVERQTTRGGAVPPSARRARDEDFDFEAAANLIAGAGAAGQHRDQLPDGEDLGGRGGDALLHLQGLDRHAGAGRRRMRPHEEAVRAARRPPSPPPPKAMTHNLNSGPAATVRAARSRRPDAQRQKLLDMAGLVLNRL